MNYDTMAEKIEIVTKIKAMYNFLNINKGKISPTKFSEIVEKLEELESKARIAFTNESSLERLIETLESETNAQKEFIESTEAKLAKLSKMNEAVKENDDWGAF